MNLVLYFHLVIRFQLFHAMGQSFSCSYCSKSNFKSLFYLSSFKFAHQALTNLKSQPFWEYFHKFRLNCSTFRPFFHVLVSCANIASPSMLPKFLLHCNSLWLFVQNFIFQSLPLCNNLYFILESPVIEPEKSIFWH